MADRRTMGEALSVSDEKLAFIYAGRPASQADAAGNATPPEATTSVARRVSPFEESASHKPRRAAHRSREPQTALPARESHGSDSPLLVGQLLVPMTTRLRPETVETLRRICLERRLRGTAPWTQQDILQLAIEQWLKTAQPVD